MNGGILDRTEGSTACTCDAGLVRYVTWLVATVMPSYRILDLIYWRGVADMPQPTLHMRYIFIKHSSENTATPITLRTK